MMKAGHALVIAMVFVTACALAATGRADEPSKDRDKKQYLVGQFLVASDKMGDPRFAETVIYMVRHNAQGAMGLVVNRVIGDGPLAKFFEGVGIDSEGVEGDIRLHYGGPVEMGRGFILHTDDYDDADTVDVADGIALSVKLDVLKAMAQGQGPKHALVTLGYAGWAPLQLEGELARDDWLTAPADVNLLFDNDWETKWDRAIRKAGVKL